MDATLVRLGIPAIALALAALFVAATWRTGVGLAPSARRWRTIRAAAGVMAWLAAMAAAALTGLLGRFDLRPPPMIIWFASLVAMTVALAWSRFGGRFAETLPLAALIGFQAFRLPLELVMHRAATVGIMPNVMSFTGYNFDIITGVTALPVAWLAWRGSAPGWVFVLWNVIGQLLLLVVALVALAASPIFRAFGDKELNVWVTEFPYVWIAVMVAAALFGHVVTLRKLLAKGRARSPAATAAGAIS